MRAFRPRNLRSSCRCQSPSLAPLRESPAGRAARFGAQFSRRTPWEAGRFSGAGGSLNEPTLHRQARWWRVRLRPRRPGRSRRRRSPLPRWLQPVRGRVWPVWPSPVSSRSSWLPWIPPLAGSTPVLPPRAPCPASNELCSYALGPVCRSSDATTLATKAIE